jgi:hypothetical protein
MTMLYRGATSAGPSNRIWRPTFMEPTQYFGWFDNFLHPEVVSSGYATYNDTGVTFLEYFANDELGGGMEVAGNDADEDEGSIQTAPAFQIDANGNLGVVAFEARIKKASIADGALCFFAGLAENGYAAADALVDATGEMKDADFIGFRNKADAGEEMDFVYMLNGQTLTEPIANVQTMVADTWYKVGFVFDPAYPADKKIKVFVDNVEQTTYVTQTNLDTATGSAFPAGQAMGAAFATKTTLVGESKAQISMLYAFQQVQA